MGNLEPLRFRREAPAFLELLDQRALPLETKFVSIPDPSAAWTAIKDMVVRGAPAIAIAAALALAVDLVNKGGGSQFESAAEAAAYVKEQLDYLVTSRPTAVNLADAARKLSWLAQQEAAAEGATAESVTDAVVVAAEAMLASDVAANRAIGKWGAEAVLEAVQKARSAGRGRGPQSGNADAVPAERPEGAKGLHLLTHCNAGSLATASYGTALGVIRATAEQGRLGHAFCTETRPYNQGSRLTAYELVQEGYPATLVCDSAAASLMAAGRVDAIVVGADRVAANGDTANKIGTYALAVKAAHHGIPFFIAAPTTTLDPELAHGALIPIEERDSEEVTHFRGQAVAAPGINVWNPAFDVTPAHLIHGIITEKGVIPRSGAAHDVRGFLDSHGLLIVAQENGDGSVGEAGQEPDQDLSAGSDLPGFYALTSQSVVEYLAQRPHLGRRVGPLASRDSWQVKEVGDGNINYVYIVEGPEGALVVKQGLPYIRIAKDWKLSQERAKFEAAALQEEAKHAPEHVPEVFHVDESMALIVMEYLAPPHLILRVALTKGHVFPHLARHVGSFLARTLFNTSLFALDTTTYRKQVAQFQNDNMNRLTEQVIFTDPYYAAPVNRHTAPHLDGLAEALRGDWEAKAAMVYLKGLFVERQQALLHGDLHTGSWMVTQDTTYAIDPEFATYGPIAFDVCKMIANLLLAFFAADGHAAASGESRSLQQTWMLQTIEGIWKTFRDEFQELWTDAVALGTAGDLAPQSLFGPSAPGGPEALQEAQRTFFKGIWEDSLRFAGAVMLRRIFGIAHIIDFEQIVDPDVRALCERAAVTVARALLVSPDGYPSVGDVMAFAQKQRHPDFQTRYPL
eukprot:jgi/Botrbrau1/23483/Bobra.106_1s0035.1